ncbi:MAG: threonine synthase [Spirochaetaceae bacterium]|jgi:threonine synthase|nr:threonine synthase [Spirochaetaceae bacterium]
MYYYSTRDRSLFFSFKDAALTGLAPDGGLFIPGQIPAYRGAVKRSLSSMSFCDIACETILPYVEKDLPPSVLEEIIAGAFSFPAPLVPADREGAALGAPLVLELFHGPTAAFKDFGARFMARTFSYLRRGEDRPLRILTATSGDTGGAVADGFFGVAGIAVTILYPKGRVSELQEKQIAGLGGNISALAVEGSFDDCQTLVKAAFGDAALGKKLSLSSANSINISRLLPQAVYYAAAAGKILGGRLDGDGTATPRTRPVPAGDAAPAPSGNIRTVPMKNAGAAIFCVPSGNFGNLTAGLYAMAMGAPIAGFIAATNINRTVPDYLESGEYRTRLSQPTISNAMDVGAPSNFERMSAHWNYQDLRRMIRGVWVDDDETRSTIGGVYRDHGYYLDPHGAVAWTAVQKLRQSGGALLPGSSAGGPVAVLATAHPAKFSAAVEPLTGPVPVPRSIQRALDRTARARTIPADPAALRDFLLEDPV